ncbi:MAG: GTP-binding protein [Pseudomonadota bacterium]
MTHTRLPVHVLTGFLGSGKTTLLSALLSQPALKDTLVIVNEIGEVSFDHLLLTEVGEEIVVQLEGGCVCCIVRGDLLRTLSAAHAQLSADGSSRFARVVIETSGLATPDAIIRTIMLDAKISTLYTLGRVAATYDCLHGADTLETFAEARAQVAAADTLVLTK